MIILESWMNRKQNVQVDGKHNSYTFRDLFAGRTYAFQIRAENSLGRSQLSQPVYATTLEEIPSGAPVNLTIRAMSASKVSLHWKRPPTETLNGKLLGYYAGIRKM